jgi:hypothetical protein
LLENAESKNLQIMTKTLQCLIDFVKIYYDFLGEFSDKLLKTIFNYINVKNKDIAVPVIEIFNTIATEDKERSSSKSDVTL